MEGKGGKRREGRDFNGEEGRKWEGSENFNYKYVWFK
jgi:hypothetical protein